MPNKILAVQNVVFLKFVCYIFRLWQPLAVSNTFYVMLFLGNANQTSEESFRSVTEQKVFSE